MPTEEAANRAREINAAYSVLSNPDRRADYDASMAEHRRIRFEPVPANALAASPRSLLWPVAAIGITVLAAVMIAFAISPSMPGLTKSDSAPLEAINPTSKTADGPPAGKKLAEMASLCPHALAPNLIKQELFRLAEEQASGDRTLLAQAEPVVSARLESVHGEGDAGGCGGWLSLDIPPGMVVDGGRTSVAADLDFTLTRIDEGVLQLAQLSGAKGIIRSLSTLAPEPRSSEVEVDRPAPVVPAPKGVGRPAPATKTADPCSGIAGRPDRMLCQNGNLASLDRQLSSFYRQSWERADERKRALLVETRQGFNTRRDACASQNCMTTALCRPVARDRRHHGRPHFTLGLAPDRPDQRRDAADQGGNREQCRGIENEHSGTSFSKPNGDSIQSLFPICSLFAIGIFLGAK